MKRIQLTKEQIDRIDEICNDPLEPTDYVRRYIKAYRKKDETKTQSAEGT